MVCRLVNRFNLCGEQLMHKEICMLLVGIVAKKREVQAIRNELKGNGIEIIEITKESIRNIKNVKFKEIIFLQNINLKEEEYGYMKEIISKAEYLILNEDIGIEIFKDIDIQETIKLITFGFNSKSTITISSVRDNKIIVCIQREVTKENGEILEYQEKQIISKNVKKIYNDLAVFIIKELHNL